MLVRFFLFLLLFSNYSLHSYADEKQLIINRLLKINNFTFNFKQISQGKIETGTCFLVFNNKLRCNYFNEKKKEIIINNKTLVVIIKKFNKNYFYPVSKSPFQKILNKNSLINLIKESNIELNDNIDIIYVDKDERKISVFFDKKNYELIGWKIKDKLQNEIYFTLKIQSTNTIIKDRLFKIPSTN